MAVFTPIDPASLRDWLGHFSCGSLLRFEGVSSGIENTNYFVTTRIDDDPDQSDDQRPEGTEGLTREWVLTLFERLRADELPFYLELMAHLAARGLPVPSPQTSKSGSLCLTLAGKPAVLVNRLPGRSVETPTLGQIAALGEKLAQMHWAARDFTFEQANSRGLRWARQVVPGLIASIPKAHARLLEDELTRQTVFWGSAKGITKQAVHADLFRDNVLFDGDRVGGIIDFYFAATTTCVFDLAVVVNDWCFDSIRDGESTRWPVLNRARWGELKAAYWQNRPLSAAEIDAWPMALRAAALRFWVSRLYDSLNPRPADVLTPKDPEPFAALLQWHREHPLGVNLAS